jgi:GxxExxY protein
LITTTQKDDFRKAVIVDPNTLGETFYKMDNINSLTQVILKYAFKVHTELGPGLLESCYKTCLHYELTNNGILTEKEKPMPLYYEEIKMDVAYLVDLMVENSVIIEVKCVEFFNGVHAAQLLTYLKLSQCKVGLLLNFKTSSLRDGIKRLML